MSQTPTPDSSWKGLPPWLFFAFLVIGPPIPIVVFARTITQSPVLIAVLVVVYEAILFILRFTGKIWGQLEDPLAKHIAQWVTTHAQEITSRYRKYYCQYLCYQHRDFDVKGLTTLGTYTLELDQVFVELNIDPTTSKQTSPNPIPIPQALHEGSHSLWDYLAFKPLTNQHLVIIGPPGSGKTTLLKHITLTLVTQRKQHPHHNHRKIPQKLPILLFLRDHTQSISHQSHFSLVDALHDHLKKWEQREPPAGWTKRQLDKGQCLVMLDGLDEVADPETRQNVVNWVQTQMMAFNQNRFLVTSRPFGYHNNPLSGVAILKVRSFSPEQVERFIHRWYLANEIISKQKDDSGVRMKARAEAKELLQRLRNTPALFALTVNPLLLTMITTVHRYSGELPGNRMALYAEICEVFLGKRQKARGQVLELTPTQMQLVLEPLAYHLMLNGKRDIPIAQVQEVIEEPLAWVKLGMLPETFLQLVENASGLLLEQESGIYSFAHLTFQEYLTAAHIHEKQLGDTLIAYVEKSWWRETIRLYCAMSDATSIITTCLRDDYPSVSALTLALDYAEEARTIQPTVKAHLETILNQGIEDTDPERRQVVAEAFLTRRLHQMVYVKEGVYRDTSLITCAEYQVFLNEQYTQSKYYQPDHWKSLSFPAGSGKTPVLGIRRSDALAFCDWLTTRDKEGWHYRLSRVEEWPLEERQRQKELRADTGYWTEDEPRFVWSQSKPLDVSRQQFINHLASALADDLALTRARTLARTLALDLDHALDPTRARDRAHAHDRARAFALARDLDLALARDFDLDLARDRDLGRNLAFARNLARDRNFARDRDLARDLARDLDLARDRNFALTSDLARDLALARDHALELYIAFFLLQERITGNLSAYEGILLVKDRQQKNNLSMVE